MEEFFLRMVERVGFPVAVSILSFWAVYKLFTLRESERGGAIQQNTKATQEQTEILKEQREWWKRFGSDPFTNMCKYNTAQKIELKADEEKLILEHRAEVERNRVLDDAKEAKRNLGHT